MGIFLKIYERKNWQQVIPFHLIWKEKEIFVHFVPPLFSLKKDVDKEVLVHVWLEGTDERCTDNLIGADYSIQLRFIGTDENGRILDGE